MPVPDLHRLDAPGPVSGLVLMLHGGQQDSQDPVGRGSASFLRSRWMQRRIARRLHGAGVSLWLLRYAHRGWNAGLGPEPSPVTDTRWALEVAVGELGGMPVVLLGHSMGGRTAVAVADHPAVAGVVALAPWLPPGEPTRTLAGKRLAAAHGRADRITSFAATRAFVHRAASVAAATEMVDMGGLGHYMLRGQGRWDDVAADRSLRLLGR